jgi:hypothetical protein
MELVEFLRDRYDDEARMAQAIGGDRWQADDFDPYGYLDGAVREHILCHGPARVLREVEAKRRILDRHQLGSWRSHVLDADVVTCQACGTPDDEWPCPDLRLLAMPYADHPDYQPEWAPVSVA